MNPFDSSELLRASDRLLRGDVVAIPTETVYGLAAAIDSEEGLRKIFALKERPFFDPLIIHVSGFQEAASLAREWPPLADFLARMFWPGPLTVVVPKADHVNPLITSGLDTVAIRYPAHPIALELLKLVGRPLAAPSANKFGRTSPSRADHVRSEFPDEDLLILNGGDCDVGVESTVIAIKDDAVEILRPGGVTADDLRAKLTRWSRPTEVRRATDGSASPGTLKHHYMPKIPLVIVKGAFDAKEAGAKLGREIKNARELVLDADPAHAARELYAKMRELGETKGVDALFVRFAEGHDSGLWQAIWDRLTRAASLDFR